MKKYINILILLFIVLFLFGCTDTSNIDDILPGSSVPVIEAPDVPEESNLNINNLNLKQSEDKMTVEKLSLPEMLIDKSKNYTAKLTSSEGVIEIKLYADKTPITVN